MKVLSTLCFLVLTIMACQSNISAMGKGEAPPSQLQICSALNFSNDTWPSSFTPFTQAALELGLNISGSFEGASGWANLTNNFDGQGLSMGLLNQNLGQGTLQPMLIEMRNNHIDVLERIFSPTDLQSLLGMLAQWESESGSFPAIAQQKLSIKDFDPTNGMHMMIATPMSQAETASVKWAVSTLYSGSGFLPNWQTELTALGNTPEYVSIQIEYSVNIHAQSAADVKILGVQEVRAYLMAFDIEVQDGGIYTQDFSDYSTWLRQNSSSSDTDRLTEVLNLRLRHVLPKYVADVQSRKMAIINGSGVVHGVSRNLEQQYCFNRLTPYITN